LTGGLHWLVSKVMFMTVQYRNTVPCGCLTWNIFVTLCCVWSIPDCNNGSWWLGPYSEPLCSYEVVMCNSKNLPGAHLYDFLVYSSLMELIHFWE
jgi:hypothetical protein